VTDEQQVQKLLQGALKAAREGNAEQARKAFLYVLKMQPTNEVAWMGLATVAQDQREQIIALQKAVDLNPQNTRARAALERITGTSQPPDPLPGPPPPVARVQPPVTDGPTIILPTKPAAPVDDTPSFADEDEYANQTDEADQEDEEERYEEIPKTSESTPPTLAAAPISTPAPTSPVLPETPLFSHLALTPQGEEGVPVPKRRVLDAAAQQGDTLMNAYLHHEMEDRLIDWQRKPRSRAGEREITILRAQVGSVVAVVLLLVVGIPLALYLNSPEYVKLVFAPTFTITPTFTLTPSNTPGATLTASPMPLQSSTPTPTLDASITPGRPEVVYRPEPTEIYYPPGAQRSRNIDAADALINQGEFEDASAKLLEEQQATKLTGDFMAYYYLSRLQFAQNNVEAARKVITDGKTLWSEAGRGLYFGALVEVSEERILYLGFQDQLAAGTKLKALKKQTDDLITKIKATADFGGDYDEPYLLLADVYRLTGDYQIALDMLTEAQTGRYRGKLFGNTRLRLKKAEIYRDMGTIGQALFELDDLLRLNPFEEPALRMRIDLALQESKPGLAVIYAADYQYYYPENIEGYRLMGDAFVLEDKIGLAMVQYTRALQGDSADPAYSKALASRAAVYTSQGRDDLALADYNKAVEIQPQNMDFRGLRYQLAYRAGEYALAAEDLVQLQTGRAITAAQFTILSTQLQVVQKSLDVRGQQQALTQLRRLRPADIPTDLQPLVNELTARLNFALGSESEALNALERALAQEDTASRHVLRGEILQAQADAATRDDAKLALFQTAQREYDFVLSWSVVYRYPFVEDVQTRYQTVTSEVERLRAALAEKNAKK